MIIDAHIHIFPDQFCPGTVQLMAKENPEVPMEYKTDGSADASSENLKQCGIDYGIMMPIVTKPKNQRNVNNFAAYVQNHFSNIISFGSVHPRSSDWETELNRILKLGLHGIKIHPDYQGFFLDDPIIFPVYESIEALGLPLMFHTGFDPHSPKIIHGTPKMVRKIAESFPKLTIVAAHMGAFAFYSIPIDYYDGLDNLYFDMAIAERTIQPERLKEIIDHYGADRVMFGTDSPWSDGSVDLPYLDRVGLTASQKEKVLSGTAVDVYNLNIGNKR